MRLYVAYLKMLFKSQLMYRTSFIIICVGQFFVPFTVFIGFTMLFQKFGNIQGYNFYEMALCYSVAHMAFSLAEAFFRGFDSFSGLIREGEFDRLLLRPRNLMLQVLGSQFELSRIGRLAQSILVLMLALGGLNIGFPLWKWLLLSLMILSGFIIFASIFIAAATMCFWTVESTELANILTDGGREMSQFPLNIYSSSFKWFFTWIVPFGMMNYYPLMILLDREAISLWHVISPLYGLLFFIPCTRLWYYGVGHYKSSGS